MWSVLCLFSRTLQELHPGSKLRMACTSNLHGQQYGATVSRVAP